MRSWSGERINWRGGADAGGAGGSRRAAAADVCGVGAESESTGVAVKAGGSGLREPGGGLHGALGGVGGVGAGDLESWWGVCAAGPEVSGGAAAVDAGRQWGAGNRERV